MTLDKQFEAFSKFGDTKSTGQTITLTQSDKWMKQANIIDKKTITTTDTGIVWGKFKAKTLTYEDFIKFVEMLAKDKKVDPDAIKEKLVNCGAPGMSNVTQATHVGGVDRLTDTKLYTGAHKERFDESGKGKGMQGREDVTENTGYTGQYKGQGTYDQKKS